jgi:opacity protein-like surface antigen
MKRLLLVSVAMMAISAPSFAQEISFDGLRSDLGHSVGPERPNEAFPGGSLGSADGTGAAAFTVSGITFEHIHVGAGIGPQGQSARTGGDGAAGASFDDTFVLARRAGYLVRPNLMPYGSIGWEVSRPDNGFPSLATRDDWHNGARFGAGFEYAFTPSIFARAEIDYTRFQRLSLTGDGAEMTPDRTQVLFGVTYRFR